jgi:hypothetical protein
MNNDRKAAARFFMRVEQVGTATRRDEHTLPLFPLIQVMGADMLESDAKWEASKTPLSGSVGTERSSSVLPPKSGVPE